MNAARAHRSGAVMGVSVGTSLNFPQSRRAQMKRVSVSGRAGWGSGYLPSPGEGFCHLAVPPSIAGGDEVSHPAALQEGGRGHLAFTKDLGKSDHFHQSQTDDGCLGVVPTAEAIAEASSDSNYVLQRPQRRG